VHRATAAFLLVGAAAAWSACAAKVRQDVFDETMQEIRGELGDLDSRVSDNSARIDTNEAALAALREDLEALSAQLGEVEAQITEIENGIRFAMPVHFDFDRAEIRPIDRPTLNRFAAVVEKYYPAAVLTVEGFADPAGSAAYNKRLSERRAENVAQYLTDHGGLDASGIRIAGYGEERLVIQGARGPGRAGLENRRVAFIIEFGGELPTETVATAGT
jgi:peptidoglycan-associated lipoprotein